LLLHKTTTPPPGTPVRPGDEILVEISWRPFDFAGPDLHKVIDCVYINGLFAPGLSGGERLTPNDGHFAWHYFVPLDVPPGSGICDQGFASGSDGWDEYGRRGVSPFVCFPVDLPPPPPPPPCCAPPPVETTTTTTTATPEEPRPYTEVDRVELEAPEEAPPAVLPEQRDVLPRTGGDAGMAHLATGALALALAAGRVRRGRQR
jgi:hypothetical protein